MNENDKVLVTTSKGGDLVEVFQQHAVAAKKIQDIAIKQTHPTDWFNFGGNAWLDAPGCERVARALGLTIKDWTYDREDFKDDDGEYYIVTTRGKVGHAPSDMWVDAVGVQWSRKPFFWKEGDRKKHIGEIHPGNIIKDSYSDMFRNGVTRLLGLRGLPWSYLKNLGITQDNAQKVEFETGKRGGKARPAQRPSNGSDLATEEQISTLCRTACKRVIGSNEESIKNTLPDNLTRPQLNSLLSWLPSLPGEIGLEDWEERVREVTYA